MKHTVEIGQTYGNWKVTERLKVLLSNKHCKFRATKFKVQCLQLLLLMKWNFKQENFIQKYIEIASYAKQNFNKYQRTI